MGNSKTLTIATPVGATIDKNYTSIILTLFLNLLKTQKNIKTIRADENLRDVPILMVTTEADDEEKRKATEAGADGYLVKPVSADMVSKNIRGILAEIFEKGGSSHA